MEIKQPNYDQLIFSWYKKSTEEDYFSKFIFLYLAFDGLLRKKFFINSKNDREAIESLKKKEKIRDTYLGFIKMDREVVVSFESIIRELKNKPLRNVSRNNGEIIEITVKDTSDWQNLIEFIYTVRNNLFHGEKNPEELRDWSMVYYAYKLLKPLVDIMLSHEAFNLEVEDYDLKKIKEMVKNESI